MRQIFLPWPLHDGPPAPAVKEALQSLRDSDDWKAAVTLDSDILRRALVMEVAANLVLRDAGWEGDEARDMIRAVQAEAARLHMVENP